MKQEKREWRRYHDSNRRRARGRRASRRYWKWQCALKKENERLRAALSLFRACLCGLGYTCRICQKTREEAAERAVAAAQEHVADCESLYDAIHSAILREGREDAPPVTDPDSVSLGTLVSATLEALGGPALFEPDETDETDETDDAIHSAILGGE